MTSLINRIEKIIKKEKTTPERKLKDDSTKSSSEILSELFGAFNAAPPKIENVSAKKAKKSKKKHKKEKKKRSRSCSSESDSDDSEYSHKRKKRKKKTKKRRDSDHSPSLTPSRTPIRVKPDPEPVNVKCEPNFTEKSYSPELSYSPKQPYSPPQSYSPPLSYSPELASRPEPLYRPEPSYSPEPSFSPKIKLEEVKVKDEKIKIEPKEESKRRVSIKIEDDSNCNIDASLIPMPATPTELKLDSEDLRFKLDSKKREAAADNDKAKGKIQIKNLKFSAVFEENVKKAEEEAKKRAEKYEEGEYTDSSNSSVKEEVANSHFPKSSDPGGILKRQAAEEIKISEEEKSASKKSKHSEKSHKSSRKDRSRSPKRSTSKAKRSKSRSPTRKRHRRSSSKSRRSSKTRHRSHSRSKRRSSSRSRNRHRHHSPRYRERGRRSRSPTGVKLADSEKKRLLEVARRNAINMLKNGAVPAGAAALPPHTRNQVMAAIQSGGKSVDELTDFCKHLSKKEALGELSSVSSHDDDMSENEDTLAFHHPFLVKEKAPIVMNIRGGAPLPVKTNALPVANKEELRLQFPVSSGSQHREKASEWVPVSPPKKDMQVAKLNSNSTKPAAKSTTSTESSKSAPLALPAPPTPPSQPYMKNFTTGTQLNSVPALPAPGPQAYPPGIEPPKIDVASIVSQKIAMIRKEQEDTELTCTRGFGWSKDSSLGQFTGTTGAQILTPKELASGTQAWAKKLLKDLESAHCVSDTLRR